METKICTICKIEKPLNEFSKGAKYKQIVRLGSHCKQCGAKRVSVWRKNNPEKFKAVQRRNNLKRCYGITQNEYEKLFKQQNGVCKVCGQKEALRQSLSIDHNHKTNKVRGLLCHKCNRAIGLLQDDITIVNNLLVYLQST